MESDMGGRKLRIIIGVLGAVLLLGIPGALLYRESQSYEREKAYLVAELQRQDEDCARRVLNNLIGQREHPRGGMDRESRELLETALSQNTYEKSDWYGIEKDRQWKVIGIWFLCGLVFVAAWMAFYYYFRRDLERENLRLYQLLERGIPVLQRGIEEDNLEGLVSYEREWKDFIKEQPIGRIKLTGKMILRFFRLQYRFSEREQERKQQMQYFVENVAHQWKTPLARMTLSLELMTEDNWREKKESCLEEIQDLRPLVERLLNVARMKSGKVSLQTKPMELRMLLLDASRKVKDWQKIHWMWRGEREEYMIEGDEVWLEQAFFNLYENAGKQEMEVPEIVTEMEQEDNGVRIKIKDGGGGIDAGRMKDLFHRFYTGEQGDGNSTGIGLHLACEIIGRHQGKIDVYNGERGAVFEIFLPQYALKGKL